MIVVEKVVEKNKQWVIDSLRLDVIRHVFAFYDIQYEPEHATMYVASENGNLKGYVLIYTALDFPSVVIECDNGIAEKLIEHAPENHFIMHVPSNLLPFVKRKFPNIKYYVEDWMLVKKGQANFFKSELLYRLGSENDASRLAVLLSSREDRPMGTIKKYMSWISKTPIYGVSIGSELVSYAGSFLQLPQVWMIGGVYTHPSC
jgi:hypothetical protein